MAQDRWILARVVLGNDARHGTIAQALPQFLIPIEGHDMASECGGIVGGCCEDFVSVAPAELLDQQLRGDHRQPVRGGFQDLVGCASRVPGRLDEQAVRVVHGGQVGHRPAQSDAGMILEPLHADAGRGVADDREACFPAQFLLDQR